VFQVFLGCNVDYDAINEYGLICNITLYSSYLNSSHQKGAQNKPTHQTYIKMHQEWLKSPNLKLQL